MRANGEMGQKSLGSISYCHSRPAFIPKKQESQAANRVAEKKEVLKPERLEFKSQLPHLLVL